MAVEIDDLDPTIVEAYRSQLREAMGREPGTHHITGAYTFDTEYHEQTGSYPEESPLNYVSQASSRRLAAVRRLAEQGATEGERAAARAALERMQRDEEEYAEALDAEAAGEL